MKVIVSVSRYRHSCLLCLLPQFIILHNYYLDRLLGIRRTIRDIHCGNTSYLKNDSCVRLFLFRFVPAKLSSNLVLRPRGACPPIAMTGLKKLFNEPLQKKNKIQTSLAIALKRRTRQYAWNACDRAVAERDHRFRGTPFNFFILSRRTHRNAKTVRIDKSIL